MAAILRSPRRCSTAIACPARSGARCRPGCDFPTAGRSSPPMSASSPNRRIQRHESRRSSHANAAIRRGGRDGGPPRRSAVAAAGQGHARGGTAAATRRRDRARRAGAGIGARRDRHRAALFRVAHAGARGAAPTGGERPGRSPRPSRRRGGAAVAGSVDRNVRGDGGTRGAVRGACRRADAAGGSPEAGSDPRGIAGA